MPSVQIKYRCYQICYQIIGHTVRSGGRGMVYCQDDAGQELDEQCDYRNLPSTLFLPSPPDVQYSNQYSKVKQV